MAEQRTIWKYPLQIGRNTIQMPAGARVLTVQSQAGTPCLWALVFPHQEQEARVFDLYGTGHPMPANCGEYVGTVQDYGGQLIWHIFDSSHCQP
jgi:hypothetical protein